MSSVYNPVAVALPAGITVPSDGTDYVKAAAVNVPLEAIANGVKFCTDRKRTFLITGGEVDTALSGYAITSTSYTDVIGAPLLTIPTVSVGDLVKIWYTCHQYSTGDGRHRLALGPSKFDAYGAFAFTRAGYSQFVLMAEFNVLSSHLSSGSLAIYLMSRVESTGWVSPMQPHFMIAEVEK